MATSPPIATPVVSTSTESMKTYASDLLYDAFRSTVIPFISTTQNSSGDHLQCDRIGSGVNKTYLINGTYEGVPENLLINFVVWIILLIVFTFLRKLAWDYGRIALVTRNEEKSLVDGDSKYNVWTTLFYGEYDRKSAGSQESLDTTLHMQDKGLCAWIPAFFKVKDVDILRKSGRDAVQYLQFQRYLLVYLLVICLLSIVVVLPVNIQGSNSDGSEFGDTTISNIRPKSPLLWIHALLSVVYLIIAVYFMRHFSVNLQYDDDEQVSKTLMVSNIPKDKCFKSVIMQHFQEAYPEALIEDVQFAYNIAKLVSMDTSRQRAGDGKRNSEIMLRRTGKRPMIRPYFLGQCCCCDSCGCRQVDAVDYYSEEERILLDACEQEKITAFHEPLGIAFVSFEHAAMAERIRTDFRASCKGAHNPQTSSVFHELTVIEWDMKYAPIPENIYWENLSFRGWKWWLRAVIVNAAVIVLLFFFTTPTIVMSTLDKINYKEKLQETKSPVLEHFLPTILLWTFSALLPNLVYYSDQFVGHWTKTAEHHAIMRKTFVFLLLMVLILPSLGLTSVQTFFEWTFADKHKTFRWQCVFLAGNGAFFVNYVVTSAFIGTALELLRFSQLFMYAMKLLFSKSAAEKSAVRKSVIWDFQFGIQYAWMLCVFAIIVAYSILCPLVVPFGIIYVAFKHIVDRYNIYFAYAPSKIDKHIHSTAVTFVIVSVILLQMTIVFFSLLRTDKASVDPVFIFSTIALFVTLLVFFGRIFFGWFRGLSPIKYKAFTERDDEDMDSHKPFVPSVLLHNVNQPPEEMDGLENATLGYGSTEDAVMTAPRVGTLPNGGDMQTDRQYK